MSRFAVIMCPTHALRCGYLTLGLLIPGPFCSWTQTDHLCKRLLNIQGIWNWIICLPQGYLRAGFVHAHTHTDTHMHTHIPHTHTFQTRGSGKNWHRWKPRVEPETQTHQKSLFQLACFGRKKRKCKWLVHVRLFETPWTVDRQPPLSTELFRQERCSG